MPCPTLIYGGGSGVAWRKAAKAKRGGQRTRGGGVWMIYDI